MLSNILRMATLASVDILLTIKLSEHPIETTLFSNLLTLSETSWSESLTHTYPKFSTLLEQIFLLGYYLVTYR